MAKSELIYEKNSGSELIRVTCDGELVSVIKESDLVEFLNREARDGGRSFRHVGAIEPQVGAINVTPRAIELARSLGPSPELEAALKAEWEGAFALANRMRVTGGEAIEPAQGQVEPIDETEWTEIFDASLDIAILEKSMRIGGSIITMGTVTMPSNGAEVWHDGRRVYSANVPDDPWPVAALDPPADGSNPFVLVRCTQLLAILQSRFVYMGHSDDDALRMARAQLQRMTIAYPREKDETNV